MRLRQNRRSPRYAGHNSGATLLHQVLVCCGWLSPQRWRYSSAFLLFRLLEAHGRSSAGKAAKLWRFPVALLLVVRTPRPTIAYPVLALVAFRAWKAGSTIVTPLSGARALASRERTTPKIGRVEKWARGGWFRLGPSVAGPFCLPVPH